MQSGHGILLETYARHYIAVHPLSLILRKLRISGLSMAY